MRAVVQRVRDVSVSAAGRVSGIPRGLLVYLGVARGDTETDAGYLAEKITTLRIFPDDEGKMNRSVLDTAGEILVVSQFTLLADARKGRRPSYTDAEEPDLAKNLYEYVMERIRARGIPCRGGFFQAHMEVSSVNDGPVTILLDSRRLF